ncbi:hypothetical protein, partial [Photobacterium satsumensis]|uniref:hypothetical protein n=1 Tax=Photobacterium satsumensis TaxID=2910239 RepID=UPI003D09F3A4
DGDLLMVSDKDGEFHILGYPVVEWESLPDAAGDASRPPTTPEAGVWLMFGDMGAAIKVSDVEGSEKFINNPYNEGFKELKYESKHGVFALDTSALVIIAALNSPYIPQKEAPIP